MRIATDLAELSVAHNLVIFAFQCHEDCDSLRCFFTVAQLL